MSYLTEKLIKVLTDFPHAHEKKVEALLQLGKEVSGAGYALLSSIKDYHYQIEVKVEKKPLFDSFYTLDQTFCKASYDSKEFKVIEDIEKNGNTNLIFYTKLGLKAFISMPVMVNGRVVGTISYLSEDKLNIDKERLDFLKLLCFHIQDSVQFDEMKEKFDKYYSLLEKKNEDLSKFSYMVAHDLKSPLRAFKSLVDFMGEDLEQKQYDILPNHFAKIKERANHMEHLIRDILEYSKIGTEEIVSEKILLKYFINDICFEVSVSGANIEIYNKTKDLSVLNKKVFLYQIISNIVNNAVKYCDKEKCVVEISSVDKGDSIEIIIEDNGPGIEEEYRSKIFEVFQVAHNRSDVESTGIGLSIVKRLVERMGGDIFCTNSTALGGSKFVFSLLKEVN